MWLIWLTLLWTSSSSGSWVAAMRRNESAVEAVIAMREKVVEEIAELAEKLYRSRLQATKTCRCSWHDCGHDFGQDSQMECTRELIFGECQTTGCDERLVGYNFSVVHTPEGINPEVLSPRLKQSICTYADLEEVFRKVRTEYGVANSWTYIGLQDGHFRSWPMAIRDRYPSDENPGVMECAPYDPRRRPWYSAASTGPKDVVLLVDRSASTTASAGGLSEYASIWTRAQQMVIEVLDTFIHTDFINVVLFSSEAEVLWRETPLAAVTPDSLSFLKQQMRTALPSGSTNVTAGFEKAIELLIGGHKAKTTSGCNKIILFLTEGRDTDMKTSDLLRRIEALQIKLQEETESQAHIFPFSIGPDADESTAQQIACANQGLWSSIRNFNNPLSDMIDYLAVIATARGHQGSVWVDPYEDSNGLGLVTTVSMPVFSRGGGDHELPFLLGVVGHDVLLSDLVVGGYDHESILNRLVQRSKACESLSIDACHLQVWRSVNRFGPPCADVYPQRSCYRYQQWHYKNFDDAPKDQAHAEAECQRQNGTLAPIRSREHFRFLSAIASADRSWIGGRRVIGVDPIEYRFNDSEVPSIDQYFDGWAPHHPQDLREMCITIDRRGISRNLMSTLCEKTFHFICEFPLGASDLCDNDDVLEVTSEDGTLKMFAVPMPDQCPQLEQAHRDAETVAEAEDLLSSDVICDFGAPVFHEELYCCTECHNNSQSSLQQHTSSSNHSISNLEKTFIMIASLLLIFWLLVDY